MGLHAAALLVVPTSDTAYKVMMSVKCFMIDSNYYKWSCYDDKGYRVTRITCVTALLPISCPAQHSLHRNQNRVDNFLLESFYQHPIL